MPPTTFFSMTINLEWRDFCCKILVKVLKIYIKALQEALLPCQTYSLAFDIWKWGLKYLALVPHDIFELLSRTSSRIVRVAAASGLAREFWIVLSPKFQIKNSTSSVYSRLCINYDSIQIMIWFDLNKNKQKALDLKWQ